MPVYTTVSGRSLSVSRELGKGGEGIVYDVSGYPDQVAKIYHSSHCTDEKRRKLQAMIASPPQDDTRRLSPPHISIAWPLELLYEQEEFAGYLMPHISQSPDIFKVYNPQLRTKNYPAFDWRYLHRTAKNFATALNALHVRGYVMGDVNQKNIMVTTSALVTLVDTDSFQVPDSGGRVYRCPVGVPEYTPPELQGTKLDSIDRTIHHDDFGLGVIIFQLLMEGFHPFTGVAQDPTLSLTGEVYLHCIKQGVFPYQFNSEFHPPPGAPSFSALHPEIQNLLLRCFINGYLNPSSRPTAHEWLKALDKAEKVLMQCGRNALHWYSDHVKQCPWCEREKSKPLPIQQGLPPIPNPANIPTQKQISTPANIPTQKQIQTSTQAPTPTIPRGIFLLFFGIIIIGFIWMKIIEKERQQVEEEDHKKENQILHDVAPMRDSRECLKKEYMKFGYVISDNPKAYRHLYVKSPDKETYLEQGQVVWFCDTQSSLQSKNGEKVVWLIKPCLLSCFLPINELRLDFRDAAKKLDNATRQKLQGHCQKPIEKAKIIVDNSKLSWVQLYADDDILTSGIILSGTEINICQKDILTTKGNVFVVQDPKNPDWIGYIDPENLDKFQTPKRPPSEEKAWDSN